MAAGPGIHAALRVGAAAHAQAHADLGDGFVATRVIGVVVRVEQEANRACRRAS